MDTISDMLTRIRNAQAARKSEVSLPFSKFKQSLAKVLVKEGYVLDLDVKEDGHLKFLNIRLKYDETGQPVIAGIKRVSKPGQRIYANKAKVPKLMGGMGTTIVSTSKGLMTDKTARSQKIGGEIVCQIW